ncbi:MAG: DUF1540 domain-containing protein [bacterium]
MVVITKKIKCTVDTCQYYKNNVCTADHIEVAKNVMYGGVDMETGIMNNQNKTTSSNETKCITYKPKKR